jgi:hypothetical protein
MMYVSIIYVPFEFEKKVITPCSFVAVFCIPVGIRRRVSILVNSSRPISKLWQSSSIEFILVVDCKPSRFVIIFIFNRVALAPSQQAPGCIHRISGQRLIRTVRAS